MTARICSKSVFCVYLLLTTSLSGWFSETNKTTGILISNGIRMPVELLN